MAYDILQLTGNGVNVVYGGSNEEKAALAEQILHQYPGYRFEINKNYFPKKFGPLTFKVKKTVYQIILEDAGVKKVIGSKDLIYISEQIKALDCNHIVDRFPRQLSLPQRERTSVIIDGLNGKKCYLFYNSEYPNDIHYLMISDWLLSLDEFNKADGRIIWIALMEENQLLDELHKSFPDFASKCKFYRIEDGKLNYKENLYNTYSRTMVKKPENPKTRVDLKQETPANTYNQKKPELEKMLDKMARRYLQKDEAEPLFALLEAVGNPDYYDMAIDIVNMYLSFHAGNGFFLQVKERCIQERDSLLQPVTGRETKKYFDNENVSIIVLDAQDTYVVGCSYKGKIKAGDKFVNSETGDVYTISGAIMINEKTSPDDFVLSVDTGKINRFDCIMESQSSIALKSGDLLDKYAEPAQQQKSTVTEENVEQKRKNTALTCDLKIIDKERLSRPRRGNVTDANLLGFMIKEYYKYDVDVVEFRTKDGIKYDILNINAMNNFISSSEDEVILYVKGKQRAPVFEHVLSSLFMNRYLDAHWYNKEVRPRYNDIQVQYLYQADDMFAFMSIDTYESYEVYDNMISDDVKPLVENNSYRLLLVDEQPVSIRKDWLPAKPIEKQTDVRQQKPVAEEEKRDDITAEKTENIVQIEKLIYECSVEPLGAISMTTLMYLLKEAGSVEHYEQLIEVITMHLLAAEDSESNFYKNYENFLKTCEKEKAALLSTTAVADKSQDSSMSEKEYIEEQKRIASELYDKAFVAEINNDSKALEMYLEVVENEHADNDIKSTASVNIAKLYEFGRCAHRDIKSARKWYKNAVDFGNKERSVLYKSVALATDEYEEQLQQVKNEMLSSETFRDWTERAIEEYAAENAARLIYWSLGYSRIVSLIEKYAVLKPEDDVEEIAMKIVEFRMDKEFIELLMADGRTEQEAINEHYQGNEFDIAGYKKAHELLRILEVADSTIGDDEEKLKEFKSANTKQAEQP